MLMNEQAGVYFFPFGVEDSNQTQRGSSQLIDQFDFPFVIQTAKFLFFEQEILSPHRLWLRRTVVIKLRCKRIYSGFHLSERLRVTTSFRRGSATCRGCAVSAGRRLRKPRNLGRLRYHAGRYAIV